MRATPSKTGFSLVELSIVLVILGLLVGGILAGQSLIRAAELRAVSSESQRFSTALNAFRDKYFALPGDMSNATSFGATWVANGDANGQINPNATPASNEASLFWIHLTQAGLVEGQYANTGNTAYGSAAMTLGKAKPASKLSGGGWNVLWLGAQSTTSTNTYFDGSYGNAFTFGGGSAFDMPAVLLKAEEAWNLDTKMDDGRPATGSLMTLERDSLASGQAAACTNGAGAATTMVNATYALDTTTVNCALVVKTGY